MSVRKRPWPTKSASEHEHRQQDRTTLGKRLKDETAENAVDLEDKGPLVTHIKRDFAKGQRKAARSRNTLSMNNLTELLASTPWRKLEKL